MNIPSDTPVVQAEEQVNQSKAASAGRLVADKRQSPVNRQESGGTFQGHGMPFSSPTTGEDPS
jgi:hypothetical protein